MKKVQKTTKILAIILWILSVAVLVIAGMQHRLLSLLPIIAYNRPQNFVGWMVVFAVVLSLVSVFLRLFVEKD